ncbi:hypothetical protein KBB05_04655 [Patescibacteria group bacterium]|nr:hypothetical protein [Patescibacteria group bacterium]
MYSKVNIDGFLETPAIKVSRHTLLDHTLIGRILEESLVDAKGKVIAQEDTMITKDNVDQIIKYAQSNNKKTIEIRPYITGEVEFISPENDHHYTICESTIHIDEHGNIIPRRVPAR